MLYQGEYLLYSFPRKAICFAGTFEHLASFLHRKVFHFTRVKARTHFAPAIERPKEHFFVVMYPFALLSDREAHHFSSTKSITHFTRAIVTQT